MASNPRKTQAKWIKPKMQHNRFIRTALSCGIHVIFCIRIKTIIDTDTRPPTVKKVPVCESQLPYEFLLRVHVENEGIAHFLKVPKPFQKHIRDGERITVQHGELLMEEASKGQDISRITAIVHNLEEAASSGLSVFKTAWAAAWRNGGPSDTREEIAKVTPDRAELNKHLDRLKRLAEDADKANDDKPEDREPGDIGGRVTPETKTETAPADMFDDGGFPGDTP